MTTMTTLVTTVLAIFSAEQTVQDKRSDAAREFKASANAARKASKTFDFSAWVREQSKLVRDALVEASPLAAEFNALDTKGRQEHAATHGKKDGLSVLIGQYRSVTVRFSEMKRLYLLDRAGDEIARQFFAGKMSIDQALELLASQYANVKVEAEAEGSNGDAEAETEASTVSPVEQFRQQVAIALRNGVSAADLLGIVAEVAQAATQTA